jgi:hypothetical protein
MKHTPGPWVVNGMGGSFAKVCRLVPAGVIVSAYAVPQPEQEIPNAHLLAAAPTAPHECDDPACPGAENKRKLDAFPDLLEALKEAKALAMDWAANYQIAYEALGFNPKHRAILKHIDDAIAKAEGRQ